MLAAILWDNDGTLVDTEPLYFRATREIIATAGVALTQALFVGISLDEGRSVFDLARARGVNEAEIERLRELRNRRYEQYLDQGVTVREGIVECLQALVGRTVMGVVTSSMRAHFERMHAHTALRPYFDFVLTQEEFARTKPDPEPYLLAAARHGLDPRHCLVIEDSRRGVIAAKRAGMQCWALPTTFTPAAGFPEADRMLRDARELRDAALRLIKEA